MKELHSIEDIKLTPKLITKYLGSYYRKWIEEFVLIEDRFYDSGINVV